MSNFHFLKEINRDEVTCVNPFLIIILLFLLVFLLEKGIEKFLGIKRKPLSKTPGKRVDQWGRTIIVVIFICFIPFISSYLYLILFFTVLFSFQTFMEWKFMKESKQYISSLISSIIIIMILIFSLYFYN